MSNMVVLQVIHKMSSISLYLFIACYSTENNFCKTLGHECSEADASNGPIILNEGQSFMFPETSNIVERNMWSTPCLFNHIFHTHYQSPSL